MWQADSGEIEAPKLKESMDELFGTVHTGSVSLFAGKPLSFTAYVARLDNEVWLTSKETTDHVTAINDSFLDVAVCVWRQPGEWGEPLYGIQLTGSINLVTDEENARSGLEVLHNRFPGTKKTLPTVGYVLGDTKVTCLQRIMLTSGKIRDERRIGKGMHNISWRAEQ